MPLTNADRPTMEAEAKVKVRYKGAYILDLGSHIDVVLERNERGVRWCLKDEGWQLQPHGTWRKISNAGSILGAQSILGTFYGEPIG